MVRNGRLVSKALQQQRGKRVNNSTHGSLTCSGKGSGLSARIGAAQPRAEAKFNARTFLETERKAKVVS